MKGEAMNITKSVEGSTATIAVEGKLSVATSPDLENEVKSLPEDVTEFIIDLEGLEYISSAGLRVLVTTQKLASQRNGSMTLRKPNDEVMEVFDMTGLSEIFTVER